MLLVQRLPDKHDEGEAYARWELPGGRLDGGHDGTPDPSVWAGALREWSEETGASLPEATEPVGGWVSEEGTYEGFVVRVPEEAALTLNPQRSEVSRAAWWDPDDLEDPKVRDKLVEQLGDIQPILKSRHTDAIIAHYTPIVQDAMAQVLEGDTVRHAIRVAYTAQKQMPQPTAPGTQNTPKYPLQLQALMSSPQTVAGAAGVAAGAALAGPVGSAIGGVGSAIIGLLGAKVATNALAAVLLALYGDAVLQGAYEASQASRKPLPDLGLPEGYWTDWVPGHGELAGQLPGEALQDLLRQEGITLRGISDTQINRIADVIASAVREGTPMKDTVARVDEIIHDAKRAALIATTEFARAEAAARRAFYRANHVAKVAWVAYPDCCVLCRENADASPIPIRDEWPHGDPPVHPACRCGLVPAL